MIQIDISMPNCCYDCPFSDDSGDYPYCWVLHQNRGYNFDTRTKRFPNCPLKETDNSKHDEEMAKRKEMCKALFNRCATITKGMMCTWCGLRKECDAERTVLRTD